MLRYILDYPQLMALEATEWTTRCAEATEMMANIEDHFTENGQYRQETPDETEEQDRLIADVLPSIQELEKEFNEERGRWADITRLEDQVVAILSIFTARYAVNGNH
ncbi:MAG: hypothetical protein Q9174_004774 [Haloplaca sp. 1 TL-2023]